MSNSELIQKLIRTNEESIAALKALLMSSTTKKVYTRSDSELVNALYEIPFTILSAKKFSRVLNGEDFTIDDR